MIPILRILTGKTMHNKEECVVCQWHTVLCRYIERTNSYSPGSPSHKPTKSFLGHSLAGLPQFSFSYIAWVSLHYLDRRLQEKRPPGHKAMHRTKSHPNNRHLEMATYTTENIELSTLNLMASGIKFYSSFQISRIIILDIQNNYFGYPK